MIEGVRRVKEDNTGYDKKGLGVAEMTFISVDYPKIWDVAYALFDTDEKQALDLK